MATLFDKATSFLSRNLKVRYLLALGTIAVLVISGQILIQVTLHRQTLDQKEIEAANDLQESSQELSKTALNIQVATRRNEIETLNRRITELMQQIVAQHAALKNGDATKSLRGASDKTVLALFKEMEVPLSRMKEANDRLPQRNLRRGKLTFETISAAQRLVNQEALYREITSKLLYQYDFHAQKRIQRLKWMESLLLLLTLITLYVEARFIFQPVINQLKESLQEIENSENKKRQILERSLAEKKTAEERLRKFAEKLRHSNESLEEFAHTVSHDLKEPLRTVSSYVGLLKRECAGKLSPEADEYMQFAIDGTKQMRDLIEDLLNFSCLKSSEQKFEKADIQAILNRVILRLRSSLTDSGVELAFGPLPVVVCDPPQMEQLFQNLVSNAIKFRCKDAPKIEITSRRTEEGWLFQVRDNGIGMRPEDSEKIFELFKRLHSRDQYPGTGIGLAICKKVTENHNGRIWVESEFGKGSSFFVLISDLAEASANDKEGQSLSSTRSDFNQSIRL